MMLKNSLDKYIQGGKRHEISDISIKKMSQLLKIWFKYNFLFYNKKI